MHCQTYYETERTTIWWWQGMLLIYYSSFLTSAPLYQCNFDLLPLFIVIPSALNLGFTSLLKDVLEKRCLNKLLSLSLWSKQRVKKSSAICGQLSTFHRTFRNHLPEARRICFVIKPDSRWAILPYCNCTWVASLKSNCAWIFLYIYCIHVVCNFWCWIREMRQSKASPQASHSWVSWVFASAWIFWWLTRLRCWLKLLSHFSHL